MRIIDTWVKDGYSYACCIGPDLPYKQKVKTAVIDGKNYEVDSVDFMESITGERAMAFRVKGIVSIPKAEVTFR